MSSTSLQLDANAVLPTILASAMSGVEPRPIHFMPLSADGRTGAEVFTLFDTKAPGQVGVSAALVRYLPGAQAAPHRHTGYELIYVLDGVLQSDGRTVGPNTLLVLEPGSVHAPASSEGCMALVIWEKPVACV